MLNSVNIISSINYEHKAMEKVSYAYEKNVEIVSQGQDAMNGEPGEGEVEDFDKRKFVEDIMEICSKFKGNAIFNTSVITKDGATHSLDAYLCINEDLKIDLEEGEEDVVINKGDLINGIYVPKGMKDYIEDGKVKANGEWMYVEGVIEDTSIDLSYNEWSIMYENLSDDFKDVLVDMTEDLESGVDGVAVSFLSNTTKGEEYYTKVEDELEAKGYKAREYRVVTSDEEDSKVEVSEYVIILQGLNIVLTAFSIISCMYVVSLWMDRRAKEFMIRKSFGGSSLKIIGIVARNIFKLSTISMCLALCIQWIYRNLFPVSKFMLSISIQDIAMVIGGMFVVVLLMLIVPMIKIIRLMPATGLKEL
jgi:ABC-type antimicrobial peptide transport system permease subunit